MAKGTNFEIWAQLVLSDKDCERIREFFITDVGINPKTIIRNLHLTYYYSRRPIPEI